MLSYNKLQDRPREFVAATGGTLAEFEQVLPAFQAAYASVATILLNLDETTTRE